MVEAKRVSPRAKHELVIVANRLPVRRSTVRADGAEAWITSPGGLVAALAPIVRERGGAWIGWPGSAAGATAPFAAGGIANLPVAISRVGARRLLSGPVQLDVVAALPRRRP